MKTPIPCVFCGSIVATICGAVLLAFCVPNAMASPHSGHPEATLPPVHPNPNIAYYGAALHAVFPQDVILNDPKHGTFTNIVREPDGPSERETFDSVLDATADLPGMGIFGVPVRLTGSVTTVVYDYTSGDLGTFDAEIVSMSLSGNVGGFDVVVGESVDRRNDHRTGPQRNVHDR